MKTFLLIALIYWSGVESATDCSFGEDFHIKSALYLKEQLIILTTDNDVYHIQDFKFDSQNQKFSFKDVKETQLFTGNINKIRFMFTLGNDIISINTEDLSGVKHLVGFNVTLNSDMTATDRYNQFSILPYTSVPKKDPLNLMSLFAKFPDDHLPDNLRGVVSFPNKPGIPERFLVYYFEKANKNGSTDHFKRHIMIRNTSNFLDYNETNWIHDNSNDKCIDESVLIDNCVRLTKDYVTSGDGLAFDIIEFIGTNYTIRTVQLDKDNKVKPNLSVRKSGSLMSDLDCAPRTTWAPWNRFSDGETKPRLTWIHIVLAIIAIFFIIGIVLVSLLLIADYRRLRGVRKKKESPKQKETNKNKISDGKGSSPKKAPGTAKPSHNNPS